MIVYHHSSITIGFTISGGKKMIVIQNDKDYKKEDQSTKRTIDKGINKLDARLSKYRMQKIKIENIFNDDILIHDIINKKYYVYKCRVDNVQLRILYTVVEDKLVIISHYCKKNPTKEYINYFEKVSSSYIYNDR